jgi:hypothetical protein
MSSAEPLKRGGGTDSAAAPREKWTAVALSTGPGDREAAQAAARELYRRAGLRPPEGYVWLDSPLEGIVAASVFDDRYPNRFWFRPREEESPRRIFSALNAHRGEGPPPSDLEPLRVLCTRAVRVVAGRLRQLFPARRVWDEWRERMVEVSVDSDAVTAERLKAELFAPLREKLLRQTPPAIKSARWWRLLEPFDSTDSAEQFTRELHFGNMPGNEPDGFGFGTHDAWRLAVCERALAERGEGDAAVLAALSELSRQCGWWWPLRHLVVFTERPTAVGCEATGRLHAPDGPALAHADGWQYYAWRGMEVPADLIEGRERLTVADIEAERNVELRRVMIDIYGQERFLLDSGAHAVHEDECGTLYRLEVYDDEPLVMVKVRNSTPEPDGSFKSYFLRVPPNVATARAAVAWTFGMEESAYGPSVET